MISSSSSSFTTISTTVPPIKPPKKSMFRSNDSQNNTATTAATPSLSSSVILDKEKVKVLEDKANLADVKKQILAKKHEIEVSTPPRIHFVSSVAEMYGFNMNNNNNNNNNNNVLIETPRSITTSTSTTTIGSSTNSSSSSDTPMSHHNMASSSDRNTNHIDQGIPLENIYDQHPVHHTQEGQSHEDMLSLGNAKVFKGKFLILSGWIRKSWELYEIEINNHMLIIHKANSQNFKEYNLSPFKCILTVYYDLVHSLGKEVHELRLCGMIGEKKELVFRSICHDNINNMERDLIGLKKYLLFANGALVY